MSDFAADKTPNATYTEGSAYTEKPSSFSKCKAFARKFWWLLLVGFLAANLIIILCLVYAAFPNIAQKQVDKSTLEVISMMVMSPTNQSVQIRQDAFLHSSSIFTPHLDAFPAALFLEDTEPNIIPFAYLQLPPVHSSKSTPVNLNQTLKITDMDQFIEYTKTVMNNETLRVALRGRTTLHLGKLPAVGVNYNEVLTFKGLNKLKGFDIISGHIDKTVPFNDTTTPNLIGEAYIPNPSLMTFEMGDVTYDLYSGNTSIGHSLLPNLILRPGNNTVKMLSTVSLLTVAKLAGPTGGILQLDIRGNSSVYNGQHLPYYEAAIRSNPLRITFNVTKVTSG